MSLKLRTRNHPSLQLCFREMPLIPVPILGDKMSSIPSKWLFNITGGRHEQNLGELSVSGFIFTYVQNIFQALLWGTIAPVPPSMYPPLRHITCQGRWVV